MEASLRQQAPAAEMSISDSAAKTQTKRTDEVVEIKKNGHVTEEENGYHATHHVMTNAMTTTKTTAEQPPQPRQQSARTQLSVGPQESLNYPQQQQQEDHHQQQPAFDTVWPVVTMVTPKSPPLVSSSSSTSLVDKAHMTETAADMTDSDGGIGVGTMSPDIATAMGTAVNNNDGMTDNGNAILVSSSALTSFELPPCALPHSPYQNATTTTSLSSHSLQQGGVVGSALVSTAHISPQQTLHSANIITTPPTTAALSPRPLATMTMTTTTPAATRATTTSPLPAAITRATRSAPYPHLGAGMAPPSSSSTLAHTWGKTGAPSMATTTTTTTATTTPPGLLAGALMEATWSRASSPASPSAASLSPGTFSAGIPTSRTLTPPSSAAGQPPLAIFYSAIGSLENYPAMGSFNNRILAATTARNASGAGSGGAHTSPTTRLPQHHHHHQQHHHQQQQQHTNNRHYQPTVSFQDWKRKSPPTQSYPLSTSPLHPTTNMTGTTLTAVAVDAAQQQQQQQQQQQNRTMLLVPPLPQLASKDKKENEQNEKKMANYHFHHRHDKTGSGSTTNDTTTSTPSHEVAAPPTVRFHQQTAPGVPSSALRSSKKQQSSQCGVEKRVKISKIPLPPSWQASLQQQQQQQSQESTTTDKNKNGTTSNALQVESKRTSASPRSSTNSTTTTTTTTRSRTDSGGGNNNASNAIEIFRPSSDAYTPRQMDQRKIPYRPAEQRTPAMSSTMGPISRPNFKDALRRVAMILQQHVVKIERRLASQQSTLFSMERRDEFREDAFLTPRYKCTMVRGLRGSVGGISCGCAQIRTPRQIPTASEIYEFAHVLFRTVHLSSECSIVCLIYVERLMEVAHVPLVAQTWRPVFLCGLLLASKVWQDWSTWNVEFASVYPQFSRRAINRLERLFLQRIKWDLYISSSLYAKYYFALRSLMEKQDFRQRYNRMLGVAGTQVAESEARKVQRRTEIVREEALAQLSKSI